jgi:hypothetical protein
MENHLLVLVLVVIDQLVVFLVEYRPQYLARL